MKTFDRYALSLSTTAILFAGCGGLQPATAVPPFVEPQKFLHHQTFGYTGKRQEFQVPAGVKLIAVVARGGAGATLPSYPGYGGRGGRVFAELPVTPGEQLHIFVGGAATGSSGGYNGGGEGGYYTCGNCSPSSGGGGASDIRAGGGALVDRILVAGGGGGEGADTAYSYGPGGAGGEGGGATAGDGAPGKLAGYARDCKVPEGGGGQGGLKHHGGSGGHRSCEGKAGDPGVLGSGGGGAFGVGYGGGGGGGYYGGGGGGGGTYAYPNWIGAAGGGGGGSSHVERSAKVARMWQGWKNARGNGLVVLSW